ncbi:lipid IV(A) 3-deoxy-D-manno-octulosonic acid transferase [Lentisalinibacter orientalis]|uniref:lipid IV(A) 3-deoxy-D-manno-octulosonic acid transferase n=1 Tax=Lentisalinibacter orientalis TaxID=2992241 RepID=UPI003867AC2E
MRFAYQLLVYLATPFVFLFWLWRGFTRKGYHDRLGQRFGIGFPDIRSGSVWIHAVSVGEVQAAAPLIKALKDRFPSRAVVVTTVTPTGAERVHRLFGDEVVHCFAPFETPGAVRRFFDRVRPELAVIIETELWPNLYAECGRRRVPLVLASARISPRSVARYRHLTPLFREALSHGIIIAAQSEQDAQRFRDLGAAPARTFVTGNIKFDVEIDESLAARGREFAAEHFPGRSVWIAASTHAGEEEIVLAAHRRLLAAVPDALLMLVPRHPERFPAVADMVREQDLDFVSRTGGERCSAETRVFLGDTMGELPLFYAASDIAFVAGSLVPIGGHNLLEPASLGLPILTGPHLFNAEDIAAMFAERGASRVVTDEAELAAALEQLFADEAARRQMGERARRLLLDNRGSLRSLLELLEPLTRRFSNG